MIMTQFCDNFSWLGNIFLDTKDEKGQLLESAEDHKIESHEIKVVFSGGQKNDQEIESHFSGDQKFQKY